MRFAYWPGPQRSWDELLAEARHAEATGWDRLYLADHFMPNAEGDAELAPWLECWSCVAALAAVVPRISIGTLVAGNTYRHPAVLAKMAATIDELSGGRLVLGLGAGWQENEHRAYGIPLEPPAERLARFEEACAVLKGLFSSPRFSFEGRYYTLREAVLEPKPRQDPMPLLIGGSGEKVTLRIAARWADEWNCWGTVDTMRHKLEVLDRHCEHVGRNRREIQISAATFLYLSDDRERAQQVEQRSERPVAAGDVERLRETVRAYAETGVDELVIPDFNLPDATRRRETLDRFIEEVASVAR